MTELKFRNIQASPDDPVEQWGVEGILACLERGHLKYWHKLAHALRRDPTGVIRRNTRLALRLLETPSGIGAVFSELI
ncbi:MAG: hypothetical protein LBL86_08475 [Coriobacteriales bacterium]|jgi:hypothetical protein|nr:hypothetical protein [Coriobacteriales bacterium]